VSTETRRDAGPPLAERDRVFLRVIDERLATGAARAGTHLACRRGCTECCHGPFPINRLDQWRLGHGLQRLRESDPARAAAVRARAQAARTVLRNSFPGDAASGRLSDDEAEQDAFFTRHASMPCPALDPASGACDLYADRPVSCRTYGLPVRLGTEELPPCRLCFVGASAADIEACRVEPDPHGAEDAILTPLEQDEGDGSTIVAFALAAEA
jgi:Fe-S-cluster containining protein